MRSRPYLLWLPAAMGLAGCAGPPVEEAPLPAVTTARAARRTEMPKTPNVQTETPRKASEAMPNETTEPQFPVMKTDAEWKKILTPEQYYILREKGTERPFSGKYEAFDEVGTYTCAACGQELFQSSAKFESGCGWPSFFEALDPSTVRLQEDLSHGMRRTEVLCSRCGGHLGHVFDDGPRPTGKRFCINSGSLNFLKAGDTP